MTIAKLNSLRNLVAVAKSELERYAKLESVADYSKLLEENINELDKALSSTILPDFYKVAVVGRFKVGKSSFVNAFTNSKIAGVSDKPETAAISVFRNADKVFAEVEMLDEKTWLELKNTEDRRYFNFSNFNERHKKDNPVDLAALEAEYIKTEGLRHKINLSEDLPQKKAEVAFRKCLKEFTSSQSPLHYLVKQIVIYTPNSLLGSQVELIDTPGLDDTELFRSELTEETLKSVDAILFLTNSGGSYGQSDKEFLIKQLRTRQIKQLQIIVTKIDETYANKKRQCDEDDEYVPTLEEFKKEEEMRIRREIALTLHELLNGNTESESAHYYKNQLENIPIHFISTHYYSDGDVEKSGLPVVKQALNNALSNSARFTLITDTLEGCLERVINRTEAIFSNRLDAIDSDFDEVEVQRQLSSIHDDLLIKLDLFKTNLDSPLTEMQNSLNSFACFHEDIYIQKIILEATRIITDSRSNDMSKHWAKRRSGGWGEAIAEEKEYHFDGETFSYTSQNIGTKIANKIFPSVESILTSYTKYMNEYADSVKFDLSHLEAAIEKTENSYSLLGIKPLNLQSSLSRLNFESEINSLIESHKISIFENLGSFHKKAEAKLNEIRNKVSHIEGNGTTQRQNEAIYHYYREIEYILSSALSAHLKSELKSFSDALLIMAESVQSKVERSLSSELDSKVSAIKNSLLIMNETKREEAIDYLAKVIDWCELQRKSLQEIEFNQEII